MAFKWALTVTWKWVQRNHYLSKVIWEKLARHNRPLKQQQQQHQHHHQQQQQQQQSVITIAQVLVFLFWFSARHLWAGTNKSKKSVVQISDSWYKRWRNISDTFFSISDNFLGVQFWLKLYLTVEYSSIACLTVWPNFLTEFLFIIFHAV